MKISYIELKNFTSLVAGMGKRHIEIDFSKSNNVIQLLVGANGSGKTSLISTFHPFAYNNDKDRDDSSLILEGEDGLKKIIYKDNENTFVIKHHYLWKSNKRTIKSYISKNDIELNPNGNVTSFLETVKMYLGIDQSYLSLLRLGSNVVNFIDKSYTERKDFSAKLLDEIGAYLKFHKKLTDDSRIIRTMLKTTVDKINNLRVVDEYELHKRMETIKERLDTSNNSLEDTNMKLGDISGRINNFIDENPIIEDYPMYKYNKERLVREMSELNTKKDKFHLGEIDISRDLFNTDKQIQELTNNLSLTRQMNEFHITQLNALYSQKEDNENNLRYVTSQYNIEELKSSMDRLEKEKLEYETNIKKITCNKDDLLSYLAVCQNIYEEFMEVISYSSFVVVDCCNSRLYNRRSDKKAINSINYIIETINKIEYRIKNLLTKDTNTGKEYILYRPQGCENEKCPFIEYYNDLNMSTVDKKTEVQRLNEELVKLRGQKERQEDIERADKHLDVIMSILRINKPLFDRVPFNYCDLKNIMDSAKQSIIFFDEEKITSMIALCEDKESYDKLCIKLEEFKKEMEYINKNSSSMDLINSELTRISNEIFTLSKTTEGYSKSIIDGEEQLETLKNYKEILESVKEIEISVASKEKEYDEVIEKINDYQALEGKLKSLEEDRNNYQETRKTLSRSIENLRIELENQNYILRQFKELSRDKLELSSKYDNIELVKEAVSNTKGVPLLFQQLYFKDCRMKMNELLKLVYDDFTIEEFVIDDKVFRIPYRKDGILVSDIKASSQGEQSFVSIALSFVLMEQSLSMMDTSTALYNIPLLDEMDATLDTNARMKFLDILDRQMQTLNCEQLFLISHNGNFDTYPVDLIITKENVGESYNQNIIFSGGV